MLKFATAAVLGTVGLILYCETAEARCGCRRSCCTPAPTCCAPAPSCCAPGVPASSIPAVPPASPDATSPAPAPSASTGTADTSVAQNGRQSYRSFSYDPAPAPAARVPATPTRSRNGWDNIGKADRKILGLY